MEDIVICKIKKVKHSKENDDDAAADIFAEDSRRFVIVVGVVVRTVTSDGRTSAAASWRAR